MGDVDHTHPLLLFEFSEQIHNGYPDGGVYHRHRLISDQNGRVGEEGPGDGDSLQLSSGELAGISPGDLRIRQTHRPKGFIDPFLCLLPPLGEAEIVQGLEEVAVHLP
ncbi:hypothetical protein ES703_98669 [subsurface metagenome]